MTGLNAKVTFLNRAVKTDFTKQVIFLSTQHSSLCNNLHIYSRQACVNTDLKVWAVLAHPVNCRYKIQSNILSPSNKITDVARNQDMSKRQTEISRLESKVHLVKVKPEDGFSHLGGGGDRFTGNDN